MSLEMDAACSAPIQRPCLFFEIEHATAPVRLWTGVGTKQWDGKSWIGGGTLLGFSGVKDDGQIAVQDITVSLSGVDPKAIDLTNISVRGLTSRLWLAMLREDQSVIPNPIQLREMDLDIVAYNLNDDGSATLSVTGQSYLWAMSQATGLLWTPEEHKRKYPDDTGFDLVHTITKKKTAWRRT
jgi:hypothetical protein